MLPTRLVSTSRQAATYCGICTTSRSQSGFCVDLVPARLASAASAASAALRRLSDAISLRSSGGVADSGCREPAAAINRVAGRCLMGLPTRRVLAALVSDWLVGVPGALSDAVLLGNGAGAASARRLISLPAHTLALLPLHTLALLPSRDWPLDSPRMPLRKAIMPIMRVCRRVDLMPGAGAGAGATVGAFIGAPLSTASTSLISFPRISSSTSTSAVTVAGAGGACWGIFAGTREIAVALLCDCVQQLWHLRQAIVGCACQPGTTAVAPQQLCDRGLRFLPL